MNWFAPVVAHVDRRGNLFCVTCRPELADEQKSVDGYPRAIDGDIWPGADDKCEQCGKQLEHVPTSRYVQRS